VAAFLPALTAGFVSDDHRFYVRNEALTELSVLWRAFGDPSVQTADASFAGLWRPLRTLSFAVDRAVWGVEPLGPHLTNVLLHGAATALVASLLTRWGAAFAGAFLGAMVFALHPVQVECVAWVSSRGDLLALVGVLASLRVLAPSNVPIRRGRLIAGLALGVAALLSKEQAVVWPALAVLSAAACGLRGAQLRRVGLWPAVLTLVFVGVRHLLLESPLQEGGLGAGEIQDARILAMLGHQVGFLLLPADSLFDWQMPSAALPAVLLGLLSLGGLFLRVTRGPLLWVLVALVPTLFIQMVVPLNILVAERFLLFALPALALLVARGVAADARIKTATVVACAGLAVLTQLALPRWQTERALWTPVAERVPGHWRASAWLGHDALRRGDVADAVSHWDIAAAAAPASAQTHFYCAEAHVMAAKKWGRAEDLALARDHYGVAVRLFPRPRQESREELAPLAHILWIDLTLGTGDRDTAVVLLNELLSSPRPDLLPTVRERWERHVERLAKNVARYLDPDRVPNPPLAPRLREWAALP
jgi:hypothetical protein